MRSLIKTIPGGEQDALFRGGLAKGAAALSALQPGKGGHAAAGRNPAKRLSMLGHEGIKLAKILGGGLLGFRKNGIAVAHCDLRQNFACGIVGNGEIGARIPVTLAALEVMLDDPTRPDSGQRKSFREIMDNGRMRQPGSRFGRAPMIDRVVDLFADKLNSPRGRELVQAI